MKEAPDCPVEHVSVNENKTRVVALFVLLIVIAYLLTGYLYLIAFLALDFLLRVSRFGKVSPLGVLADVVISFFNISNKPTDRAPKRFAAGTGLVFSLLIIVSALLHLDLVAIILTIVLAFFAFLESAAGFCAGCYVYALLGNLGLISVK
ncbi:MAG: DUF4395 domain-containing protein [Bacteroidota bacterium]